MKRFYEMFGEKEQKFHYGTHYSSALSAAKFLVRLEPFTSIYSQHQGGRFENRVFSSVKAEFESCYNQVADNRELIPEFFYLPNFLEKISIPVDDNKPGRKSDKSRPSKIDLPLVELPKWASSIEDFLSIHSQALESDYVSSNLHEWIDLIFGYKQRGFEAMKAMNIFKQITYGNIDIMSIQDPDELQAVFEEIFCYGQTPFQLFKEKHPQKKKVPKLKLFYELSKNPKKKESLLARYAQFHSPINFLSYDQEFIYLVLDNRELHAIQ